MGVTTVYRAAACACFVQTLVAPCTYAVAASCPCLPTESRRVYAEREAAAAGQAGAEGGVAGGQEAAAAAGGTAAAGVAAAAAEGAGQRGVKRPAAGAPEGAAGER